MPCGGYAQEMLRFVRVVALVIILGFLAAACGSGSSDSLATGTTEVSDELTPVAPAPSEASSQDPGSVESGDDGASESDESSTTTAGTAATTDESTTTESTTTAEPADTTTTTTEATTTTTSTTTAAPPESLESLEALDLDLQRIAVLTGPVGLTSRPGTSDLFVAEQQGRIVRLPNGLADGADTTLDLRGQVSRGNEQGLLGLAFSPDGGRLFVNFTDNAGTTTIASYDMAGNVVDPASVEILLTIPQPAGNHNGGQLAFGPDGFLYIGTGDGGGGGDPFANGQNPNTLLGSILRIDVSGASGYTVPANNPFVNGGGAPEVWSFGIRNAWRFGFDSDNGDLWIGDVGQDRFEEVTVLRSANGAGNGANLGWNATEGAESFRGAAIPADHVGPIVTYAQASGRCSITGGEVYRGSAIPSLSGTYLYGDFCTGEVFGLRADGSEREVRLNIPVVSQLTSFGLDASGEIYALSRAGGVFRIVS